MLMLGVQVNNVAYSFCLVVLVDGIGLRLVCFFPEVLFDPPSPLPKHFFDISSVSMKINT